MSNAPSPPLPSEFCKCEADHEMALAWSAHWDKPIRSFTTPGGGTVLEMHSALTVDGKNRIYELKDYPRLIEDITQVRSKGARGCLIVGSPGIGKSTFLPYLLCIQLSKQIPAVFHCQSTYYFCEDGVFEVIPKSPKSASSFLRKRFEGTLCLIDTDCENPSDPPPAMLWGRNVKLFPILVSSLQMQRYHEFTKQLIALRIIATLPSFQESVSVYKLNYTDQRIRELEPVLNEAWRLYGADFRLGLRILLDGPDALESYNDDIQEAISDLTREKIHQLLNHPESAGGVTHKLIHSVPSPKKCNKLTHHFRSLTILRMVIVVCVHRALADRQQLYHLLHTSPKLGASLGWLFEGMAIDKLTNVFAASMVSLTSDPNFDISLPRLNVQMFNNKSTAETTTDIKIFYVPSQANNPIWDGFCYYRNDEGELVGIGYQMTVGRKHSLNSDGLNALHQRFKAANVDRFLFVFVTPINTAFRLPRVSTAELKKWEFFHLAVDVAEFDEDLGRQFGELETLESLEKPLDKLEDDVIMG
ncbi:hypothetical protein GYMLUDRAFT_255786 [Collybiopsis luxurians FD-317 M1]|nr:hypothetical protein GYMLUDRAFT_255786 [Collybiopsis luxurians FD-317 M1]